MRRIAPCFSLVVSLALLAGTAHAERRDATAAEALFRAGRVAAQHGDYAAACPKFEESNRLDPTVGTVFNLADCNEHLGKVASAWQLFKEAAQRFAPSDDRLALATTRAARLEPKLPRLLLKSSALLSAEAVVRRDGVQLGTASFGVPLPVDPGDHIVTVEMSGRTTARYRAPIALGQLLELTLEPGAALPKAAVATRPVPAEGDKPSLVVQESSGRSTWGAVMLGVGGAGIATSLVLGGLALGEKKTVESSCTGQRCSNEGLQAADRGRLESTVSTVAFGAGALAAALGTYLLLSGGDSGSAPRTALAGALAPGAGFVALRTTFH
jgi:hypothetical protein